MNKAIHLVWFYVNIVITNQLHWFMYYIHNVLVCIVQHVISANTSTELEESFKVRMRCPYIKWFIGSPNVVTAG